MTSIQRITAIVLHLLCACPLAAASKATIYEGGLLFGTNGGAAALASLTASGLAPDLPLRFRVGLAFSSMNPGIAEDARHVFINGATGGTPEKDGRLWTTSFDFLLPLSIASGRRLDGYAGPRYGMFSGHFRYVGDNEEFDVTGRSWGFGAGLEGSAALGSRFSLTMAAGAEYFLPSTLHGHDATYSPDDENVNAREDYVYADADKAINQPGIEARLAGGVTYRFGK